MITNRFDVSFVINWILHTSKLTNIVTSTFFFLKRPTSHPHSAISETQIPANGPNPLYLKAQIGSSPNSRVREAASLIGASAQFIALSQISRETITAISHLGDSVLMPATSNLVVRKEIPVFVKVSFSKTSPVNPLSLGYRTRSFSGGP
ncbi:hypothetical protein CDAR_370651 [Caerostris darwini]|uniref:Uncharacterized protein n=1 Tax=Caerostris darwini TaxID=1538125 RepID=A0AAV4VGU8_9ARAC|nr:hypothetical protein CDAR_370651 [Caerostris darwini]